ncbi:MAG: hydroxyacylglutathione hydrolase [Candidatus Thiodiazotropha sp.]
MLEITPLPAFDDNYIWVVRNPGSSGVVVVDPGDETPVLEWLRSTSTQLNALLLTHHHYDHVGGVPELAQAFPGLRVYGPANRKIRGLTHPLHEGDRPRIPGLDAQLQVFEVPGHTADHIAYYGEGVLFCGDTLFAGGCGRVFDGSFQQLSDSLLRIAELPSDTQIYCAHEYTLDNLGFAQWVEPDNPMIEQRLIEAQARRDAGLPTVPSRLETERDTNPFLRTRIAEVVAIAEAKTGHRLSDPSAVFTALRQWKDREYD